MIINKTSIVIIVASFFTLFNSHVVCKVVNEDINISSRLKENILHSPFKANLRTSEGKKIEAYLYAEDERSELIEQYSCINGEPQTTLSKVGHFKVYLYDVKLGSFLLRRTKIFPGFEEIRFNVEGSDLIVLSGAKEKKSDVLLISQFGDCNGNFFEAYGFSESRLFLESYIFLTKRSENQFYGRIGKSNTTGSLIAYGVYDNGEIEKLTLNLSNKHGEIQLKPIE